VDSPVLPAILASMISLALGCWYFRSRSAGVAYLNWLLAFLFLFLCLLDLLIEKTSWSSMVLVLAMAICEGVLLYYWIAAYRKGKRKKDADTPARS